MLKKLITGTCLSFTMFFTFSVFAEFKLPKLTVFQVQATSLRIREKPDNKSKVLLALPNSFYFLHNPEKQSSDIITIDGKQGRWLNVTNGYGTVIGYVFEGFTRPQPDLEFKAGCGHENTIIVCDKQKFEFSNKTPIAGSWNKEQQRCDNKGTYFISYNPAELIAMFEDSRAIIAFIHKNGRILQFVPHWVGCFDGD